MTTSFPAATRGHTELDWLDSHHCFAFGEFFDPARVHFGSLRVLNDDRVKPATGFGAHPHDNMEIVTYVLQGALQHRDSTGTNGVIRAGDVQRMSAGTGIVHSEFNASDTDDVHFLQIWFFPERRGLAPGYEQRTYAADQRANTLLPVASPDPAAATVRIQTGATMFIASLDAGRSLSHELAHNRGAYVYCIDGAATVNDVAFQTGDAVGIDAAAMVNIVAARNTELVLFDVALDR